MDHSTGISIGSTNTTFNESNGPNNGAASSSEKATEQWILLRDIFKPSYKNIYSGNYVPIITPSVDTESTTTTTTTNTNTTATTTATTTTNTSSINSNDTETFPDKLNVILNYHFPRAALGPPMTSKASNTFKLDTNLPSHFNILGLKLLIQAHYGNSLAMSEIKIFPNNVNNSGGNNVGRLMQQISSSFSTTDGYDLMMMGLPDDCKLCDLPVLRIEEDITSEEDTDNDNSAKSTKNTIYQLPLEYRIAYLEYKTVVVSPSPENNNNINTAPVGSIIHSRETFTCGRLAPLVISTLPIVQFATPRKAPVITPNTSNTSNNGNTNHSSMALPKPSGTPQRKNSLVVVANSIIHSGRKNSISSVTENAMNRHRKNSASNGENNSNNTNNSNTNANNSKNVVLFNPDLHDPDFRVNDKTMISKRCMIRREINSYWEVPPLTLYLSESKGSNDQPETLVYHVPGNNSATNTTNNNNNNSNKKGNLNRLKSAPPLSPEQLERRQAFFDKSYGPRLKHQFQLNRTYQELRAGTCKLDNVGLHYKWDMWLDPSVKDKSKRPPSSSGSLGSQQKLKVPTPNSPESPVNDASPQGQVAPSAASVPVPLPSPPSTQSLDRRSSADAASLLDNNNTNGNNSNGKKASNPTTQYPFVSILTSAEEEAEYYGDERTDYDEVTLSYLIKHGSCVTCSSMMTKKQGFGGFRWGLNSFNDIPVSRVAVDRYKCNHFSRRNAPPLFSFLNNNNNDNNHNSESTGDVQRSYESFKEFVIRQQQLEKKK